MVNYILKVTDFRETWPDLELILGNVKSELSIFLSCVLFCNNTVVFANWGVRRVGGGGKRGRLWTKVVCRRTKVPAVHQILVQPLIGQFLIVERFD